MLVIERANSRVVRRKPTIAQRSAARRSEVCSKAEKIPVGLRLGVNPARELHGS